MFRVAPPSELKKLEALFQHRIFRMLLNKGKITQEMIATLSTWRHSGFNVFCGNRISPDDDTAMENLACYIIRASFSQERMQYLDQEGTVVYKSKDGGATKSFPALEWLAAMCSHIPNRDELPPCQKRGANFSMRPPPTQLPYQIASPAAGSACAGPVVWWPR